MNLELIKHKATCEITESDIKEQIERINKVREQFPKGCDVYMEACMIPIVEKICDSTNIPFCRVADTTISTASTYRALNAHELSR